MYAVDGCIAQTLLEDCILLIFSASRRSSKRKPAPATSASPCTQPTWIPEHSSIKPHVWQAGIAVLKFFTQSGSACRAAWPGFSVTRRSSPRRLHQDMPDAHNYEYGSAFEYSGKASMVLNVGGSRISCGGKARPEGSYLNVYLKRQNLMRQ